MKKHADNKVTHMLPKDKNLLMLWLIYSLGVLYTYLRPKIKDFLKSLSSII